VEHFRPRRGLRAARRDARFASFGGAAFDAEGMLQVARLQEKVALVTGGGTGIGRACAIRFAQEGARVAVAGRRKALLDDAVREIVSAGGEGLAVECDATQSGQATNLVRGVAARFGRLNIVVNNAGATLVADAEKTSDEDWSRVLSVNLTATFLISRAAVPVLRKSGGGSIINMGSVLSLVGMKQRAAYAAAKGGVLQLTRAMALDHAAEGIRINCICPAIVHTDLIDSVAAQQSNPAAYLRMRAEQVPMGRMGTPEDVASLAAFLASDESSWMTGAALPIDGGLSAG